MALSHLRIRVKVQRGGVVQGLGTKCKPSGVVHESSSHHAPLLSPRLHVRLWAQGAKKMFQRPSPASLEERQTLVRWLVAWLRLQFHEIQVLRDGTQLGFHRL